LDGSCASIYGLKKGCFLRFLGLFLGGGSAGSGFVVVSYDYFEKSLGVSEEGGENGLKLSGTQEGVGHGIPGRDGRGKRIELRRIQRRGFYRGWRG
jgi:hypothetical protein